MSIISMNKKDLQSANCYALGAPILAIGIACYLQASDNLPPIEYEIIEKNNIQYVIADDKLVNLNASFKKKFEEKTVVLEKKSGSWYVRNKVHPEVHEISGDTGKR